MTGTYSELSLSPSLSLSLSIDCCFTRAGEMVLMDAGSQYFGYVSDITRTWPVSGTFSAAQKDLYQLVLAVKQECIEVCVCVCVCVCVLFEG